MYTCNEDDTCAMIAEDTGVDVQELVDMNKPRFGKGAQGGQGSGALLCPLVSLQFPISAADSSPFRFALPSPCV